MRKLFTATAVCALAVGLTVAPGVSGKAQTKQVASEVTVSAAPTTADPTTTAVSATGNVKATSSCRKNRTVTLRLREWYRGSHPDRHQRRHRLQR